MGMAGNSYTVKALSSHSSKLKCCFNSRPQDCLPTLPNWPPRMPLLHCIPTATPQNAAHHPYCDICTTFDLLHLNVLSLWGLSWGSAEQSPGLGCRGFPSEEAPEAGVRSEEGGQDRAPGLGHLGFVPPWHPHQECTGCALGLSLQRTKAGA